MQTVTINGKTFYRFSPHEIEEMTLRDREDRHARYHRASLPSSNLDPKANPQERLTKKHRPHIS